MKLSTLFSAYQEAAQACEQLRAARCMTGRNKSIGSAIDVAARQWQRRNRQANVLVGEIEERILDIEEIPAHGPIGSMFKRIHYETAKGMESYPDPSGLVVALMEEVGEAQRHLSEPTEAVQRVLEISDLASTLTQISPQRRREAVAAMFDRVEINERGEFVRVIWAEEFRHAFDLAVEACTNYALDRSQAPIVASLDWLIERMAA